MRDLDRGKNLPDWLTFWDSGHRFEVFTDNLDDRGKYFIQIVAVLGNRFFNTAPLSPY